MLNPLIYIFISLFINLFTLFYLPYLNHINYNYEDENGDGKIHFDEYQLIFYRNVIQV